MAEHKDLFKPLREIKFVDINLLNPNDYNPNKVLEQNLELLTQSILTNGFCFPIVVRPNMTIIDGFHRWTVARREPLITLLGGKVPIVIVAHDDESKNVYGTITFNRARGTHLLEPMENIVKDLLEKGKSIKEISKETGMSEEEIFRLSKIDREKFLEIMARRKTFNQAEVIRKG
ncbi:ParB N-terminal domain-containing protein [Riemerella anatipestifer]|uniref:ParB N-terminal domain-containing protein n=1 Tax=Riemerella anatipestifer TaxID=34085 RepID=UPI0012B28A44|nr:ParB N-terminal domain-containing protein [Riemerella anatipestifer]UXN81010.1 ParB N-terminal domain-containing protein [Phage vB_RanS_PJN03]MBO4234074.1 transcriptional regulator [Riemerella anatipestifer]MDD1539419.1 transcriptional regulator [Riemerella anatipestifer]MDY3344407.1 ParB N-terminal domain-containing protein [Riemerella anatipestifer]MDY3357487.1 ParB N-terminal domain-containing protein [Riemerella anatipestifer]